MGVNSLNYLVFPKIIAMLMYPFAVAISMFVGILGGWVAAVFGGYAPSGEFIKGLQLDFDSFHVTYAFIKTIVFSFVIATLPSYHGFYMKGGALEVGKASTTSFVWTSVVIIILNYVLTQLLLG
jgi:phospholipid/cholesterol/gamma-HCH transport system permease protein